MKNNNKPYIIGETACHHEGDIGYLYKMIDGIAESGANAVKFHLLLDLESYMTKGHPLYKDIAKWIFSESEWGNIIDYSIKRKLEVVALCNDIMSLKFINSQNFDITAVELHAISLNDWFMLKEASQFKQTVILGIGGSELEEIRYAVDILRKNNKDDILLMYGFQSFPTDYSKINISKMLKIKDLFSLPVGYADHTSFDDLNNEVVSILPCILGFNVLEKHYTPDVGKKRTDYQSAVGMQQFKRIKTLMGIVRNVYGNSQAAMTDDELAYGRIGFMKKAIVAKRDIKKNEQISLDDLWFKRTAQESNIKQNQLMSFIGLTTVNDIKKDEIIDFTKVRKIG